METVQFYYGEMNSPLGTLLLISDGEKLVRIDFGSMDVLKEKLAKWSDRYFGKTAFSHQPEMVQQVKNQLEDYFLGKRQGFSFDFEYYGTAFQKEVWQALELIPFGETRSYKDIAIAIGNPKAVRAIGGAVNKNPFSIVVPCHRVIGADGRMVGYGGGLDNKTYLLDHERRWK